jgi:hypothetical protein
MASTKRFEFNRRLDRSLLYLFTPHPRHPLRTIGMYLLGLMWAAVLGNFVFDWLKGEARSFTPLWVCLGAVVLVLGFSLLRPVTDSPVTSKSPSEIPPPPMRGLILMLSSYSQRPGGRVFGDFAQLLEEQFKTAQNWEQLEQTAEKSNFDVPLQAIRHHLKAGSLRHVWLICTDDGKDPDGRVILDTQNNPKSPGSWRLAPYLERFIHEAPHRELTGSEDRAFEHPSRVQFHYHRMATPKPRCLVNYFGEQAARDAFQAVNYIFDNEVELAGLEPELVISDFTGGRAPHTVGMVLACLPAQRRIQYTTSPQTSTGEYDGRPQPREIRVDTSWVARLITLEDLLHRFREPTE